MLRNAAYAYTPVFELKNFCRLRCNCFVACTFLNARDHILVRTVSNNLIYIGESFHWLLLWSSGRFLATDSPLPDFLRSSGSGTAPTQLREHN
jgi:hypothetical protein